MFSRAGDEAEHLTRADRRIDLRSGVIDGRRQEDVVFTQGPPPGDYTVRVDAFSLCGQPDAQWQATATLADGTVAGTARWEAVDADTRGPHAAGAGRTAFTFTIY